MKPIETPALERLARSYRLLDARLLVGLGVVAVLAVAAGAPRTTSFHTQAIRFAEADPRVEATLGTPLDRPWFANTPPGRHLVEDVEGGSGVSAFVVRGHHGRAVIRARGTKSEGAWRFDMFVVETIESRITLAHAGATPPLEAP